MCVSISAPSVAAVQAAVEHIYPLVQEFRSERTAAQIASMKHRQELKRNRLLRGGGRATKAKAVTISDSEEEEEYEMEESEESDECFDSCD